MKIAAAQTLVEKSISANGSAIREAISAAALDGAELISFCEGALSGYAKSQIGDPANWLTFDWAAQETELRSIAALCGRLGIYAVIGGAHRLSAASRPHNSLYVFSASGDLLTRYDKRFLSNSEVNDWYTPGSEPIVFEANGYRFGCAICIECQFPEVFMEYERLGVDVVLMSSYGLPEHFGIALRAHAGLNCFWISGATPAQEAPKGPASIIGPDGKLAASCPAAASPAYVIATLSRDDPAYDIALNKARPWRAKARSGEIYRKKLVEDARSRDRRCY